MSGNRHPSSLVGEGGPKGRMGETARSAGSASQAISEPSAKKDSSRAFARALRREMTDAERKLWWGLRGRHLEGFRFRRQHALGPYVLDFCCLEAKLIVEVDGSQHAELRREHDQKRTAWLEAQGFRVIRFWNYEVLERPHDVCGVVLESLREIVALRPETSKRDRVLASRRRIYSESKS